jgi:hypothetical protein
MSTRSVGRDKARSEVDKKPIVRPRSVATHHSDRGVAIDRVIERIGYG